LIDDAPADADADADADANAVVAVRLAGVLVRSASKPCPHGLPDTPKPPDFAAASRQNAGKPDCYIG
jgi:hypothetical protein